MLELIIILFIENCFNILQIYCYDSHAAILKMIRNYFVKQYVFLKNGIWLVLDP